MHPDGQSAAAGDGIVVPPQPHLQQQLLAADVQQANAVSLNSTIYRPPPEPTKNSPGSIQDMDQLRQELAKKRSQVDQLEAQVRQLHANVADKNWYDYECSIG